MTAHFNFDAASLDCLRAAPGAGAAAGRLSSLDVICAALIVAVYAAQSKRVGMAQMPETLNCTCTLSLRGAARMVPPLSDSYFGNASLLACAEVPLGHVMLERVMVMPGDNARAVEQVASVSESMLCPPTRQRTWRPENCATACIPC